MRFLCSVLICVLIMSSSGCSTTKGRLEQAQQHEAEESLRAVAESLSGKKLTQEDLKELDRRLKEDGEARSAVENISNAYHGEENRSMKFCPVDGQRFSSRLQFCPEHHVELKPMTQ